MSDSKRNIELELKAIRDVTKILAEFDPETMGRVLKYVLEHLGVESSAFNTSEANDQIKSPAMGVPADQVIDIKTLKNTKQPKSGIDMVVLVGYYLAECAPLSERKNEFDTKDAEKYFKQAQYKLPPRMGLTLNNAKNAGYLDSAGVGAFKLNPVGYNLVTHDLPPKSKK